LCICFLVFLVGCGTEENTSISLQVDAKREGDSVVISGTTNLPDGAYLVYAVRSIYAGPLPAEPYGVEGTMLVSSGKFEITVAEVPDVKQQQRKLEVWVAFQTIIPRGKQQPDEIIDRFGEFGEKLIGPNVTETGNLKRVEEVIILD